MKYIFFQVVLLFSTVLYAQEISIIKSGSLLFAHPDESSTVLVDGDEIGVTPMLITDITEKSKLIQLYGNSGYAEAKIVFDPSIAETTQFTPLLEEYFGFVRLDITERDAEILIDGETVYLPEDKTMRLISGEHSLSIYKNGFVPIHQTITIPKTGIINVNCIMEESFRVTFKTELQQNAVISVYNPADETWLTFTPTEAIFLKQGTWEIAISHPHYETVEFSLEIVNQPVECNLELMRYQPYLELVDLKEGSRVFLDDQEITDRIGETPFGILPGAHMITVRKQNFEPITVSLNAFDNKVHSVSLEYITSAEYNKKSRGFLQAGIAATGGAILLGGILLSNNDFLIQQTTDYSDYTAVKFGAIAAMGTGISMMVIASAFGITTLLEE